MMRATRNPLPTRLSRLPAAVATALHSTATIALLCLSLTVGLTACDKPKAEDCKKAVANIQNIFGTADADFGMDPKAMIRSCRGSASRESVKCFIAAKTIEDVNQCEGFAGEAPQKKAPAAKPDAPKTPAPPATKPAQPTVPATPAAQPATPGAQPATPAAALTTPAAAPATPAAAPTTPAATPKTTPATPAALPAAKADVNTQPAATPKTTPTAGGQ